MSTVVKVGWRKLENVIHKILIKTRARMELINDWVLNCNIFASSICRTHNLDERIFINNGHLQVLQVRWHPASPTDSHLLVLLSDNSIR